VLAAITVYLLLDLLVGARYATDDKGLVVSDAIALAVQAVLVLLVWQCRDWAWIVGAIWAVLSAVGAVAQFLYPTIGGYDADAPRTFLAVQGMLLLIGAGLWFVPDLRPGHRSKIR
jgi:hypothetical protein